MLSLRATVPGNEDRQLNLFGVFYSDKFRNPGAAIIDRQPCSHSPVEIVAETCVLKLQLFAADRGVPSLWDETAIKNLIPTADTKHFGSCRTQFRHTSWVPLQSGAAKAKARHLPSILPCTPEDSRIPNEANYGEFMIMQSIWAQFWLHLPYINLETCLNLPYTYPKHTAHDANPALPYLATPQEIL